MIAAQRSSWFPDRAQRKQRFAIDASDPAIRPQGRQRYYVVFENDNTDRIPAILVVSLHDATVDSAADTPVVGIPASKHTPRTIQFREYLIMCHRLTRYLNLNLNPPIKHYETLRPALLVLDAAP